MSFTIKTRDQCRRPVLLSLESQGHYRYRLSCPQYLPEMMIRGLGFDGGRISRGPLTDRGFYHMEIADIKKLYDRDGISYYDIRTFRTERPDSDILQWGETHRIERCGHLPWKCGCEGLQYHQTEYPALKPIRK